MDKTLFITKVRTPQGTAAARLLIESLQTFGGELGRCPVWVFAVEPQAADCRELVSQQVQVIPLEAPGYIKAYPFGDKVLACAQAEAMAPAEVRSLVWLDLNCLVVQPPGLFDLGESYDAALRPVHMRNVGLPVTDPLDVFWRGIYSALGIEDLERSVESFIDGQRLRAYYNSHSLVVNPACGLFQGWYHLFNELVLDKDFQQAACQDARHRIFLFQALFSALVSTLLAPERLRLLPPHYNYPYNLHERVPEGRRAAALNDLVTLTFEGRSLYPELVTDIRIDEPLRAWLAARAGREEAVAE
jgi:hypothetical protein